MNKRGKNLGCIDVPKNSALVESRVHISVMSEYTSSASREKGAQAALIERLKREIAGIKSLPTFRMSSSLQDAVKIKRSQLDSLGVTLE